MENLNFGEKKLGFGLMRLPTAENGDIDIPAVCEMVDMLLDNGFCYFDTAHGYHSGKSETAVRECLAKRYPRSSYILTNKLSGDFFNKKEDILPYFEKQLKACGVEYFDYYLLHSITKNMYKQCLDCDAFEVVKQLKADGKIKHMGLSFHDAPELLDEVLTSHPEIEVVQIQFNYADYDDPGVQSRAVYEVCLKHNKPIIIMEPVKGGRLASLPKTAADIFDSLGNGYSHASYAIRFAASAKGVVTVLSGMSNKQQVEDNISYMQDFKPLDEKEKEAVSKVLAVLKNQDLIQCTACRYCVDGCPKHIPIPELFACMNAKKLYKDWNSSFYYSVNTAGDSGKASDCIQCRKCENSCPQHLEITRLLKEIAVEFGA